MNDLVNDEVEPLLSEGRIKVSLFGQGAQAGHLSLFAVGALTVVVAAKVATACDVLKEISVPYFVPTLFVA
jgi:hypothetical protein